MLADYTSTNDTHFHSPWSVASGQQNLTLSVSLCTQSLVLIYLLLIEYPCSVLCCLNCCCFCLLLHPQPVEALLEQIHSFHASSSVSCDTNICFLRFRCYPPLSTTGVAGRCSYSIRGIWKDKYSLLWSIASKTQACLREYSNDIIYVIKEY